MKKIICFLRGMYRTIELFSWGHEVSGHDLVEKGVYKNCTVYEDECETCGEIVITWKNN